MKWLKRSLNLSTSNKQQLYLCEFREFWFLLHRLWFSYHRGQRNFLLQRNSNTDLDVWAELPLFRQALGTQHRSLVRPETET